MPRLALLTIAAALLAAAPATAATVNVTNQNDSGNGSLRKAIADADPNDEVVVPAGRYKLTSGQLLVDKNLTIDGAGSGRTIIDATKKSRVFRITDGTVTLRDIRVTGGKATPGAGIEVTSILNLERAVVTGNVAGGGNVPGFGGGIALSGPELHLLSSSVTNNRAGGGAQGFGIGGGIQVTFDNGSDRTVSLDRSTVNGNTAGGNGGFGYGGGVNTYSEANNATLDLTVKDTTIAGNTAHSGEVQGGGGGLLAGTGGQQGDLKVAIDRSTVSGNRSGADGGPGIAGGVGFASDGDNVDQLFTVTDSTVAGNVATTNGGISFGGGGTPGSWTSTFKHMTLVNNVGGGIETPSGTATFQNSIIANAGGDNCDGTAGASSNNIESADTCGFSPGNGDKVNTAPQLRPLGSYGGFTRTMPPLVGSPAIDQANNGLCTPTDQRGVTRPQGAVCDIGSVELQFANLAIQATQAPKQTVAGKVVTYKYRVSNAGPDVALGVALTDRLPAKLRRVSVAGCTGPLAGGCNLGSLAPGASRTVTVRARALRSGKVVNRASVASFAADIAPGNNSVARTLVIRPSLTKLTLSPESPDAGGKATLRFRLSDPGKVTLVLERRRSDGKYDKVGQRQLNGTRGGNKATLEFDSPGANSPGSYRLTARVKDAGGRTSPAKRLKFKLR